tara:strand:+ start:996 stop:3134 length:2139 start_codon:yes stop_codon:yes gene_type:complete
MADLKRKQLRQFLSGSFNITGSLNVTGSVEFDKNISGSITSTGSFSRLQSDTISVTHSPFASGSGVQALMDATGSYASSSTQYVKESQTGSFGSGSDVQGILDTYVRQSESSSFASGSDLQVILAESSSYVVESETGSFASGSDFHQILAESSSYVVESETGSFASGSDLQIILAESASYVMSTNTSSFLQNSDTASFQSLGIHNSLFVSGNIVTSGSVVAEQYIVNSSVTNLTQSFSSGSTIFGDTTDDKHRFTGSIEITSSLLTIDSVGGVSGSLTSTASFGTLELTDVTGLPFATGSDLHQILAESSSYVLEQETGSFASGSDLHQFLAESSSYVLEQETGSFASGSDLQVILAESSSYVTLDETGSFASGSDIQVILAESASYLNNDTTSSLGKLTLTSDITSSITSTGSFGRVDVAENTFILGNLGIGTSTQGNRLQVAGDASIVGALDVLNSVSGGLSSTGSFGYVEQLGVKLVDSNQTGSFASGSDLQPILARSSSYMISDETASMGTTTISDLFVQNDITTSGSITAREFRTEFVSSSIIFASGSQIFGNSEDDTHAFSGSVNIGDMVLSGSRVGVSSDLDLLTLSTNSLTINGGIVVDDGANIGVDSDTNLLTLNDQNLVVNGILDSTGRIDAQSGLQVSGSSLQVGNDLTLDYTSAVSHSLVYVNYQDKTLDLVPVASASGQLVQYNGSGWVITDEIDGGTF